jgi:predicted nucleotidyltransferase
MKAGSEASEALAVVRRFIMQCHPDAEVAWLSGSRSRGESAASSDYDVIILFHEVPDGAWRETGSAISVMGDFETATLDRCCGLEWQPTGHLQCITVNLGSHRAAQARCCPRKLGEGHRGDRASKDAGCR